METIGEKNEIFINDIEEVHKKQDLIVVKFDEGNRCEKDTYINKEKKLCKNSLDQQIKEYFYNQIGIEYLSENKKKELKELLKRVRSNDISMEVSYLCGYLDCMESYMKQE